MSLTTDISKMDLSEVTEMLTAFQEENTTSAFRAMWYDEGTIPTLNEESGYCFLTNSDFQVSMMNEGILSMFISCGECGREEFEQDWDLENGKTTCEGCKQIVKDLLECEQ
jgi:formylmethanofuran dehydrogenase subunit E